MQWYVGKVGTNVSSMSDTMGSTVQFCSVAAHDWEHLKYYASNLRIQRPQSQKLKK